MIFRSTEVKIAISKKVKIAHTEEIRLEHGQKIVISQPCSLSQDMLKFQDIVGFPRQTIKQTCSLSQEEQNE